ncbi:MAG TPA: SpoIIE family protein phosphatase, partial [Acidobacteriota bacterium]|nr:SpoIIE family protein phosphatase [Acidobacteriota bacterium]
KSDFDYFSREHAEKARADELEIIRSGRAIIGKVEHITMRDGKTAWVSTTKLPWRDTSGRIIGTFGMTRDITETKVAEEKLTEERNLLRTIIDHLPARIYVKDLEARYVLNNRAHLASLSVNAQEEVLGHTLREIKPGERAEVAMADDREVMATGEPILNNEKSATLDDGSVRWSLTTKVPLRDVRGQIAGLVGISHDITKRKLAEQELARRTEEMEADVLMARQLQEVLLSRPYPVFPHGVPLEASALRFAHCYVPATTLGGDFFDILQLSDTRCGLLICDVMGHGVRAGLLTAMIRGVFQEMGPRVADPAHVMSEINEALCPIAEQSGQAMFASAFFALVDLETRTLHYANAGHPPPIVIRNGSDIERLALPDPEPAAGLLARFAYTSGQTAFHPGDRLIAFTDGLIEATNSSGLCFGEDRLCFLLGQCAGGRFESICTQLLRTVRDYTGGTGALADDVCIVAMEMTPTDQAPEQPR